MTTLSGPARVPVPARARARACARARARARARVRSGLRRARCGALAAAVGAAVAGAVVAPVVVPGAAPPAAAEACRNQATGVDLADIDGAVGPYPLIDRLGLRHAWDLADGDGVTVAVIDSGVDADHPDLADAVVRGSEFTGVYDDREFVASNPRPTQDCEGHGTAVAGLVAARRTGGDRMAGVAPGATIYPVRMADGVDRATPNTLAAAIRDAVEHGADVINLSLAVPSDYEAIRDAVADAVAADVLVVAAAGNEGNDNVTGGRMYPAAYDGVLSVGAVDGDGQPLDSSNAGPWVDLAGYGDDMVVVAPDGEGYRVEGGTSMAAAQVSGAAALVLSRFPDLTAAQVADRLTASAARVGGTVNDRTGYGIVDPYGAMTHLGGTGDAGAERDDAGDGSAASTGAIAVQDLPREEPLLSPTAATGLAVSGGLLLAVVLGLLAAPGVRRAIRRGWRPGTDPADRPGTGPADGPDGPDGPDGLREPTADTAPPVGTTLGWLGGDPPGTAAPTTSTTTPTTPTTTSPTTSTTTPTSAPTTPTSAPRTARTARTVQTAATAPARTAPRAAAAPAPAARPAATASPDPAAHRNRTP